MSGSPSHCLRFPSTQRRLSRESRSAVLALLLFVSFPGPAAAATVSGTVTDPDGRRVAGARVLVSGALGVTVTAVTNAEGHFTIERLAGGVYDVLAGADGLRADPQRVILAPDEERVLAVSLRLAAIAETVVVSGASVDLPLSNVPASVTVLTAADLRARQIDTVVDALRLVPGLTVAASGGPGALASLFPRGGESDFTLVLVDGVRVNAFGGGFDFAHLDTANVERIEIVRGPQSALYGSDAIGAVVHVITRQGGAPSLAGSLETGSFGTRRYTVETSGSTGPWSWSTAGERLVSDGFTGTAPATGESVTNEDYQREAAAVGGGWRSERGTAIRADVRYSGTERGFPGPYGSNPAGMITAIDRISRGDTDSLLLSVTGVHPWSPRVLQRVAVTHADLDGRFVSPFGESASGTTRLGMRTQADMSLAAGFGATGGIEIQRERADSTFITGLGGTTIPVHRQTVGIFGEGRIDLAGRLALTPGLRIERIHRDGFEGTTAIGTRPSFGPDTIVSVNPRIAASWFLQPVDRRARRWTRARLHAGTGIRPPDAFEIAFTDNPGLRPERSRSVDIGIEQAFDGGRVVVEATWFVNRYDDLIVAVGPSFRDASRFRTDNISNARSRGWELASTARLPGGLSTRLGYTWLDTEVLAVDGASGQAPPPFEPGDPLIRRPRHQGFVDLTYGHGPITASARLGARGRSTDVEPVLGAFGGLFPLGGHAVVDATATIQAGRRLAVLVAATNLFDRQYEEALGFPALGRRLSIGVRLAAR